MIHINHCVAVGGGFYHMSVYNILLRNEENMTIKNIYFILKW